MSDFFSFSETGDLKIEKILFDAGYPILFTCVNQIEELYLCVCCQHNKMGRKWLLAEISPEVVIKLLRDEITIRNAFLVSDRKRFTIEQGDKLSLGVNVPEDWDAENSSCLPDTGEYMEADTGEFDEEISFYENKVKLEVFKKIMETTLSTFDWKMDNPPVKRGKVMGEYRLNIKEETDLKLPDLKVKKVYCNFPATQYAA